ncbi:hypothetical protein ALC57_04993 [Trachymyrmex cornetzi]|uniref:SAP domain-containing protein n=1 Tax=Trachymyrmex cornetzi TaxID=471704 RepID=A0A151JBZ1_9HYME|nr:hypothetical protein ALC57_04993 [Trachymyrmex cornetzi]
METLGQISSIADKIRTSSHPAVYALYQLVFEKSGDRTSRKQLRAFRGFSFKDTSEEFRLKLEYAAAFSVGDLISMCNILGLDYAGTKEELRLRIIRALLNIRSLVSPENDDTDVDEESEEEFKEQQRQRENNDGEINDVDASSLAISDTGSRHNEQVHPRQKESGKTKITFNFKDIEDTIRPFDRKEHYPIERWIANFEDMATVLKVTSADIHRGLARRKLKKNESIQEYYLAMRKLASQGEIEAEAVIQYVIDGISDSSSKMVLYGARSYNEFRARLRTFEKKKEILLRLRAIRRRKQ